MPKPIATLGASRSHSTTSMRYLHEGPPGMTGLCMNVASLHGGMAFNVVQRGRFEWSTRPVSELQSRCLQGRARELGHRRDRIIRRSVLSVTVNHGPFECANAAALSALVKPFVTSIGKLDFWTEAALYMEHGINAMVIGPG